MKSFFYILSLHFKHGVSNIN